MADEQQNDVLKVSSSRFGEFEIPASSVIEVVGGVIGFPGLSSFCILDYNPPFSWLHSTESADLAFVVVNGAEFGENYSFPLPYGDRDIELKEDDDVAIVNLVSVRPDPAQTTVNLKAPLIVNLRTRRGRQIVLDDPRLSTRFPLWATEEEEGASEEKK